MMSHPLVTLTQAFSAYLTKLGATAATVLDGNNLEWCSGLLTGLGTKEVIGNTSVVVDSLDPAVKLSLEFSSGWVYTLIIAHFQHFIQPCESYA